MVAAKKETVQSMVHKGFNIVPGANDHIRLEYWVDGVRIARTHVSHGGSKDLNNKLLGDMATQCKMSREQFYDFAKCKMTEKEYRQILAGKGLIKGDS
jgi:hypothetical protein